MCVWSPHDWPQNDPDHHPRLRYGSFWVGWQCLLDIFGAAGPSGSTAGTRPEGDGGGDDGGDDGDGGRIFPGHPGPIPNAPRDNISRKGIPSLRL